MSLWTKEYVLDEIIDEMVNAVETSKDEIFRISEEARNEYTQLEKELKQTKDNVAWHIKESDALERKVQLSKQRLSEVSKHFDRYSEDEIREVYEKTHTMQTQLAMLRQREKALREKRDHLERRLLSLDRTIERAERLTSKVSVILKYLNDDFQQINEMIEEAKEKQEFGLKIIEAQEEERLKLSREIHDGPAQMLANILLRSELVDRTFRSGDVDGAIAEIKSVRKMIRSSLYEVRRIIYDLRPMALDDLGLIPTIKKYVATVAEYNEIDIEFSPLGNENRLKQKYEVALFRMMQEALQNAIKHAEASFIKVKLEITNTNAILVVKDDGKGFDASVKKDKSFGLIGMKERVEMLEGTLTVNTAPGQGTTIIIKIPL
ncbi:MAG TPA: ATP-binding protein [Bacillota bacterium]|nr:ATP-binding protein [Bacillota bacterium]